MTVISRVGGKLNLALLVLGLAVLLASIVLHYAGVPDRPRTAVRGGGYALCGWVLWRRGQYIAGLLFAVAVVLAIIDFIA